MFEPIRGGTRGGQAEFKWSDVSADKDRENYLGHSINAPTGRWQKNKDIHWYNRDVDGDAAARAEEIRKIKELEAEALSAALGYEPGPKASGGKTSGANAVPVASTSTTENKYAGASAPPENDKDREEKEKEKEKEERRRRKEEKRAKKEERRARKDVKTKLGKSGGAHDDDHDDRRRPDYDRDRDRPMRHPSRSRSPRRRSAERRAPELRRPRSRSRSVTPPHEKRFKGMRSADYDAEARERERQRDRHRWEHNNRERR